MDNRQMEAIIAKVGRRCFVKPLSWKQGYTGTIVAFRDRGEGMEVFVRDEYTGEYEWCKLDSVQVD